MSWIQLQIAATQDSAELLSDRLMLFGAECVTLLDAADQPIYEPPPGATPLWHDVWVSALFHADSDIESVLRLLELQTDIPKPISHRIVPLADENWERKWMEFFKPMCFGKRLWIYPGDEQAPEDNAVTVNLDPGLAFGTGTHPTTSLCLEWLDGHEIQGKSVIDYGCGSGILAIAALKLGAQSVWAIDNDPQAITATLDNAQRNHVESALQIGLPEQLPSIQVDVFIANILANPLMEMAPYFATLVKSGGYCVLSGVLEEQAEQVMDHYKPWFNFKPVIVQEEWVRLEAIKK